MTVQAILTLEKPIIIIDQFLDNFRDIYNLDYQSILNLDFDFVFDRSAEMKKIDPIIKIAKPDDAKEITALFKEVYKGTYPFKQMEDEQEMCKMIKSSEHEWYIFTVANQIIGCIGAAFSFKEKKGLLHGLVIKKIYQNFIDSLKAFLGVFIYLCKKHENQVLIWHGEARTNDTASQFGPSIFGMKPIGFFPNKDLFFNKVESDVMIIAYYNDVLKKYRSKKEPKILRQVINSYLYSTTRLNLGAPIIENPEIDNQNYNFKKYNNKVEIKNKEDKFGYKKIIIRIINSNFSMSFFYNPYSQNIENVIYNTENIEQLSLFIRNLKLFMNKYNARYCECFVSAYKPDEQKLFLDNGFKPCGYVPSYYYNSKEKMFEDQIIFCLYYGEIEMSTKITLEVKNLINNLNLKIT